ncbi:MAG TPA: methionine biosynthesis protein MetW [Sumerlaeia bacterium]|nr:methionine biosynthesis protein MetW [Sumerlaeia bacterium]
MPQQTHNKPEIDRWIVEHTPEGGRVLDIGCGEGDLLARLVSERHVHGAGIELSEECVVKAVEKGLSVHHGNAEEGMDHYADGTFDLVVMSRTIQELEAPLRMAREAFRIGKRVAIVFPNFGHWRIRKRLALEGRAPRTRSFPHTWYGSPNRRFFTIADWEGLCAQEKWHCLGRAFLANGRKITVLPNLRAEVAMYLMDLR